MHSADQPPEQQSSPAHRDPVAAIRAAARAHPDETLAAPSAPAVGDNRQLLAIGGAILLFVGSFLPLVSVPVAGSLNYFANGRGDGVLMILLAALSAYFAVRRRYRLLAYTGGAAAVLLAVTMGLLYHRLSKLRETLTDSDTGGLLSSLGNALASSVQIQWGWAVLAVGAIVLLALGVQAIRRSTPGEEPAGPGERILAGGLLAAVLGVAAFTALRADTGSDTTGEITNHSAPYLPSAGVPDSPPAPQWTVSRDTSVMDGTRRVTLSLDADAEIGNGLYARTPTLLIRCRNGETDLYVHTGMPARSNYGAYDETTVRIRIDNAAAERRTWNESTSNEALFARQPIALARRLAKAHKLHFEFTPFSSGPVTTSFTLDGLAEYLPEVAQTCGWKVEG